VIVVMFVLAEVALRVRQTIRYGTHATVEEYYRTDPKLGLRVPIANTAKGHISINSLGFRGPEIALPKPAGTVRLAFLGASTTWCGEVSSNEHVWPHIVTASVAAAFPQAKFDYVNGGVPGYTVASSMKNLLLRVAPLQPDVIVIYEGLNDLSGELREVAVRQGVTSDPKPQQLSWPSRYSLLWNLAEKNLLILASQRAAARNEGRLAAVPQNVGEQYRNRLTELVRAAQSHAKLVAVVTLSARLRQRQTPEQQLAALSSALFYMPFISPNALLDAYQKYNDINRDVARDTGALVIAHEDAISR
jgi:lysophospholipase L1-like esterase